MHTRVDELFLQVGDRTNIVLANRVAGDTRSGVGHREIRRRVRRKRGRDVLSGIREPDMLDVDQCVRAGAGIVRNLHRPVRLVSDRVVRTYPAVDDGAVASASLERGASKVAMYQLASAAADDD